MGQYERLGGSETSQAGESLNDRFVAGQDLTIEERKQLDVSDPRVAGLYLHRFGVSRRSPTESGSLDMQCDGHIVNSADPIDARWQADIAQRAILEAGAPTPSR